MSKRILMAIAFLGLSIGLGTIGYGADIQHMDPPFWYAGMKNHELQVMFHGKDIAATEFSLKDYPGVTVKEVAKVKNPNYLIVYLDISAAAKPGTMTFQFKEGRKTTQKTFELRERNHKVGAQGFTTKDVLYLIMPDRFANGNPDNDNLENWIVNRESGGGRHGGDLQGIKEHLDYIDALGVTAVWLNPVQFNRGSFSSGYSISDYYLIDPRLGSNEEYCDFIDTAHGRGIKVVMDMIFNHSGSSHWWIEDIPEDDWFNQNNYAVSIGERQRAPQMPGQPGQPGQQQFRRGQQVQFPATIEEFNALPADRREALLRTGQRQPGSLINTTHYKWTLMDPHAPQSEKDILIEGWFSGGMPDLNQRNRHLATYLIQNSIWWIEYSRIDGIRMDTYPYADYDFMVRWCDEIEAEYPDFNIVGEGWYPRNSAAGWWQRGSSVNANDSHLKTVMDFDLTFTTQKEILKESNTSEGSEAGLFKMYEVITQDFLFPDPNYVLTFLDNHDISRFMQDGDPVWKLKQGLTFLLTTRGIPQIYYGTEIAMTGDKSNGGDAMVRRDFPGGWKEDKVSAFTKEGRTAFQNECWDFASKLLNWRRTSKPVTEGKLIHYTPDNQTKCYVYARTDGKNTVLVMLNGSDTVRPVDMARFSEVIKDYTKGKDAVTDEIVDVTKPVLMPARGVYVLDLSK
ncbi:MAG: cyclomaltodextrinase N-terminal domain-containing protein [Bacteroidales bacterium]|nr:cyclomaltodextrinase N-terminal domain-containing protein [Bacteroidales bacterium]